MEEALADSEWLVGNQFSMADVAMAPYVNRLIATVRIGQAPQAVVYVPDAVPAGDSGTQNLVPLGIAGEAAHFTLASIGGTERNKAPTSVTLFEQGLSQVLEASVTGLEAGKDYVLALAARPDGGGRLQALSQFKSNRAGGAIVNAVGPIRQMVQSAEMGAKPYLVIAPGTMARIGSPVQIQRER